MGRLLRAVLAVFRRKRPERAVGLTAEERRALFGSLIQGRSK